MVKKIFICFLLGVFLLASVSALTTIVNIKTVPHHEVQVTAAKTGIGFTALEKYKSYSDKYGDISFNFSFNDPMFNLHIFIKNLDGVTVVQQKLIDQIAGQVHDITLAPAGAELIDTPKPESEEPVDPIENVTENITEKEPIENVMGKDSGNETVGDGITGQSISDNASTKKTFFYAVGGIIFLSLIIFVVVMFVKNRNTGSEIKVRKLSDIKAHSNDEKGDLANAEAELARAKGRVNALRNKDQIEAIRKEIIEKENELIRLRKGSNE